MLNSFSFMHKEDESFKSEEDFFSSSLFLEKVNLIHNLMVDENDGLIFEGKMLLDEEDYQKAISKFTEQIKISNNSYQEGGYPFYIYRDSFYLRGFAFYKLKKYTNAINDFDTVLSIDQRYYDAFYWRGHSNYILSNFAEAIIDTSKVVAIKRYEKNSSIYKNSLSILNDSKFMMSLTNQERD